MLSCEQVRLKGVITERAEEKSTLIFSYSLLRLSIKYRTATIIAEQAIIAIIMNNFIVGNCASGVEEGLEAGVGEKAGKV